MILRPKAVLFSSLLWTLPGAILVAPGTANAQASPPTALITSVRGRAVGLAIGKADGAVKGAIYSVTHGKASAKVQITDLRDADSTAQVIASDEGFILTVGDSGQFVGVEEPHAVLPAPSGPLNPATPVAPKAPTSANAGAELPSPALASVSSVNGKNLTLGIGAADGAKLYAVYTLPMGTAPKIRVQITHVGGTDSQAVIFAAPDDATITVGDTAQFAGIEAAHFVAPIPPKMVPQPPKAPGTAVTPLPPAPLPMAPKTGGTSPAGGMGATVQPIDNTPIAAAKAFISAVDGAAATLDAGTNQGVAPATNLPILRNGSIIGLMRIQSVSARTSTGTVLWHDDSVGGIAPGDAVGILAHTGVGPGAGSPTVTMVAATVPAAPVPYETGASNIIVPKADRSYELLASLAAKGVIKSQPASTFTDTDGARRHNTSNDVTFSRAEIAAFVREAMVNTNADEKPNPALTQLVAMYARDLKDSGTAEADLKPFVVKGFQFGVSGQESYTAFGGNKPPTNGSLAGVAFGDRYGAERYKSGVDSHTDIYGQFNDKLTFFAKIDAGTDVRPGTSDSKYGVRDAYVTYDAKSLLRGLSFDIGRQEYWWGTGHFGTGLLGDAAGGLDSFRSTFKRGSYELQSFYAPLHTGPAGGQRSLYGQNFTTTIGKQSRIGVSNTLLLPKDRLDAKFLLGAFSPISLYTISKQSNKDTNSVFSGYIETGLARGVEAYGELIFDDFSFTGSNNIENRDGNILGTHIFNPKNKAKLGAYIEYARLNSQSYIGRRNNGLRDGDYDYFYRGAPLGYPITPVFLGSDAFLGGAESLRIEGYWKPIRRVHLGAGIEFSTLNAEDQNAARQGLLPTGHSRQQTTRFTAGYDLSKSFTLSANAQRIVTDQPNFIVGEGSVSNNQYSVQVTKAF